MQKQAAAKSGHWKNEDSHRKPPDRGRLCYDGLQGSAEQAPILGQQVPGADQGEADGPGGIQ